MMKNINNKLRILKTFIENDSSLYMREIERLSGLDIKIISRELKELLEGNIVDYEIRGKIKIFFLKNNIDSELILSMTEIYRTSNFLENNKILKPILKELYSITDFLVFGSFANQTNISGSDLDLVIFSKKNKKIQQILGKSPYKVHAQYIIFDDFVELYEKGNRLSKEILRTHILFGKFSDFTKWISYLGVSSKVKELEL